jgi:hypothetical protein
MSTNIAPVVERPVAALKNRRLSGFDEANQHKEKRFFRSTMTHFLDTPSRNPLTAQTPTAGRRSRRIASCFAVALAALLLAVVPSALGQGITGTITGNVTDPTGASVPGATVTITQIETNAVHTVKSSAAGTYSVPQLPPGHYTVKVDAPSFKGFQEANIVLTIDQIAQVNATLTIGVQTDVVDVTSTGPVIQTEDSSVGSVIDAEAIQNTPLNGRLSIVGLIALAPGVQAAGAQDQLATRGVTAAVGTGARNSYGGLGSTLDGVTNQEVTLQRGEGEVPSLDAISQFKVLSTGAPAEFNQPAQIIVVSASGTNQLHGELLEFNRSKGTEAKTYNFSTAAAPARPPYERNEYGGNLSGPIVIPHVYNGKDKSFFFYAFEGFHLTQSYALSSQQPTLLERQGNFTEFLPGGICAGATGTIINNPNFTGNIINTAPNAVDQQLLNILYPKPTQAGCGTNTFEQVAELSQSTRNSVRLDHKISEKDQLHFTYLRAFYGPNHTQGSDSLQGGNSQDGEHNSNFILGYTHTFSPTLLLDVNSSFFHLPIYRTPQNVNTDFSAIIPGLGPELIEGAPQITITNITSVSESGSKDLEQDGQVNTSVTKVLAKHTLKAGFSYLYDNHWNDSAESPQRGSYSFNGHYTGIAFADFILGDPISTGNATPNNYITRNISSQYGLYVQDDWKPMPKLTINMGLRYDLQWFKASPYGNDSLYVPSLKKVVVFSAALPAAAAAYVTANPAIPVALASTVGLPNNVFSYLGQDKNNVAPRFGFAYEVKHNTVVRGAFGIYFNLLPASYVGTAPFTTLPFVSAVTYSNSSSATPTFTMNNPFSATGAFSANPSVLAQAHTTTPYTEAYNLAVEHQFGKGFDLRIGYVGQHNLKQNNYGGSGTVSANLNLADPPVVGITAQSTNLVQPFSAITNDLAPIFHSSENSLQIGAHKQYSHGIAIGAEYSWTRVLGTENLQDPSGLHPNDSYGPISGIAPQVLTVNYSYLLPFGKGQVFLGSSGNLIDKLVSGWQISGISVFQNGQPFSVTYTAPGVTGLVSGRANRNPGVALYPANKTKSQWFNTAAFAAPGCLNSTGGAIACPVPTTPPFVANPASPIYDTYGNSAYDMLRGPRFQDWDMSLQKNIAFRTRYKLQLRADSFNVFNHPNFAVPNSAITNGNDGTITAISSTPQYEQRTVEFAAKFNF